MRHSEIRNLRIVSALLCALALAHPHLSFGLDAGKQTEAKHLIDSRQLDSAEKMILDELMTTPRDVGWITLLAEVRLGQNRTREALKL